MFGRFRVNTPVKKLTEITICGHKVKILYKKMSDFGRCLPDEREIHLNLKCLNDKEILLTTLIHEIAHYVIRVSGLYWSLCKEDDDAEEALVRVLENLYFPVVREMLSALQ